MTTAPAQTRVFKAALGSYPHTKALKEGTVQPKGFTLEYTEFPNIIQAFPGVMRRQEFQISEMAVTTYLVGRSFGKPYTGIPVVVARNFHHYALSYHVHSGIQKPADLVGKRVGVRAYTVTQGVWVRGILQSEYGVDPSKVTWVTFEEPHVQEFKDPPNVERAPEEKTMAQMIAAGEIDAGIGVGLESPDVKPMFPNAWAVHGEWYRKHGVYPVNHMVIIRNDVLAETPSVAPELFAALKASKEVYLRGPLDDPWARIQRMIGGDPLPYGVEANRKGFETLVRFAHEQGLIPSRPLVDELFAPNTLHL